jgi:plasmid stabilization system protein ParE
MPRLTFRSSAWIEINRQVEYLAEQSGSEVAERFLDNLISSCELLAQMPRLGLCVGFSARA